MNSGEGSVKSKHAFILKKINLELVFEIAHIWRETCPS